MEETKVEMKLMIVKLKVQHSIYLQIKYFKNY
jgi:hypothetical protein